MVKIEAQRHLEAGNAFYEQGKYSEACEEYQKALEIEPEHVDADTYNMWGNALYSLKRYDETIEKYLRALEINHYSVNYVNWVDTLDKLTKDAKEKAIEIFQKTIEIKPPDVGGYAYNEWSNALYGLGRYEEAIDKYQKAIEIGPDYVDVYAYRNWGLALSNLKKYDEAIEKYQRAIEINSKYVDVYNDLGLALHELKKYNEAIASYEKAVEIDSKYIYAYKNWGNALYELKRYDEAIEKYLIAIEIDPKSVNYVNWVNTLDKLKKDAKEKAVANFKKIIELKPADVAADAYNNWGNALLDDFKKYDEAIEKYRKAIEINQRHNYAYRNWGLALSNLKKYDEAIEKYQRAIEINSKYVDIYNDLGLALHELKKYNEAIANYEKAVEIDSKYIYAYKNWGNALYELKRYDEAIEKYLIAIEIDPKSVNYVNWVNTLDKLKKDAKEKAVANFKKIIELKPPDVGGYAYNEWGNALANLKKYEEAIEEYKKAIEIKHDYVYAHYNMGLALANLAKYEDAIEKYKKAIEILKKYEGTIEKSQKSSEIDTKYADAYCSWGLALANLKKYDEAIEKYQKAIEIDPSSVDYANWNDALNKLTKDEKDKATEKFYKTVESKPDFAYAYNTWGNVFYNLEKYDEAIEKYKKATEINPAYADAYTYNNWGNALYKLKKHDEAIEKYQRAIEIDPGTVDYANWSDALNKLKKDEKDKAAEKFHKTIESKPADVGANAYNTWGNALYNIEMYEEAIEKYKMATEINPAYADAYTYNNWGNAFFKLKKHDEAIEKYQRAIEIDPGTVDYANWNDALNKLTKDEKDKATEKFYKTIESKPADVSTNAYRRWGLALHDFKKYNEAIEKYQKALQIDQNYVDAYNDWGNALLALKKHEDAIGKYKKALEIKPDYVYAHFNWGLALADLKKYDEAIEKYGEAIKIDSNYVYAHYYWGLALANLKKYNETFEKYKRALEIDSKFVDAYFDWGYALGELKKYEDAIEKYQTAIKTDPNNILAAYASHNIADLLWRQGKYAASRRAWEKAIEAYEKTKQKAIDTRNAFYFMYFASIPHEVLREFDMAEAIYKEGLELDPDQAGILTRLVSLYLEIMDENVNEQTSANWHALFAGSEKERQKKEEQTNLYWKAREAYKKAETILKNQELKAVEDASTLLQLGELRLTMEEYDKAEKCLLKALEKDKELATTYSNLGILYTRNQDNLDYKKAIKYFKKAYDLQDREDLTIQSNLAEAYLKAGDANAAKTEYKKILGIAPFHVESHIGLGEVYSALGEDGDEDMYEKAIYHFTQGLNIAKDKKGSKILKRKESAAALYSRGYARVKLYEASKTMKDESLLHDALEDFKNCFKNDPYNHKAKRAMEKIEKRSKYLTPQKLPEIFGPLGIFFLSVIVFISSQSSFFIGKPFIFYGKPITLDVGYYVLLTFGSLIFMVAGLYLPQILKLKVGGIELEKSPVEQITAPTTIGISK